MKFEHFRVIALCVIQCGFWALIAHEMYSKLSFSGITADQNTLMCYLICLVFTVANFVSIFDIVNLIRHEQN